MKNLSVSHPLPPVVGWALAQQIDLNQYYKIQFPASIASSWAKAQPTLLFS